MSPSNPHSTNKSSAHGQYLGYTLQSVRLCHYLYEVPYGSSASVETQEDVIVEYPDGSVLYEQVKSATKSNPVRDSAVDLWKTLGNWADRIANNDLNIENAVFNYFVHGDCAPGKIFPKLHAAVDEEGALAALKAVDTYFGKMNPGTETYKHFQRFSALSQVQRCALIQRFSGEILSGDPLDSIRGRFKAMASPGRVDDLVAAAIGKAQQHARELHLSGQSAGIDAETFVKEFRAFSRQHNVENFLPPVHEAPTEDDVAACLEASPNFIRQLNLVGISRDLQVKAASNFMWATAEKVAWAERGEVVHENLEEFDGSLLGHYQLARDEIEDINSDWDAEKRGRALYRYCVQKRLNLDARSLPEFYVPGAYNILANEIRLGWHPEYTCLLDASKGSGT